ncbi:MAG: phasin family protein [Ectothiorhodospiraceae bacterium]|nr:phasin family protein [Ectothiorhodospiraceae bacterium]
MLHALFHQTQRRMLAGQLGFNHMGELMIDHAARLVSLQLDAVEAYTRIGLDQLRALNQLGGTAGLQHYLQTQQQLLLAATGVWGRDMERLTGLGERLREELDDATEQNVISMAEFLQRSGRNGA